MTPTTKPASVTKRRGHLFLGRFSLRSVFKTPGYYLVPTLCQSNSVSEYVLGLGYLGCMKFFCTLENVYYMDGNCSVWETDIVHTRNVIFNPVCVEGGRTVNFRKLHKLEWLFT
jgi:hypothetical protein